MQPHTKPPTHTHQRRSHVSKHAKQRTTRSRGQTNKQAASQQTHPPTKAKKNNYTTKSIRASKQTKNPQSKHANPPPTPTRNNVIKHTQQRTNITKGQMSEQATNPQTRPPIKPIKLKSIRADAPTHPHANPNKPAGWQSSKHSSPPTRRTRQASGQTNKQTQKKNNQTIWRAS